MIANPFSSRFNHLRSLWHEGLWGRGIASAYATAGLFMFLRDEFGEPANEEEWKIIQLIPHLSVASWLFGFSAILFAWLFEASFRVDRDLRSRISLLQQSIASPLEIIFDPSNPARRFWSKESDTTGHEPSGAFVEYRVEIRKNSSKTVRNVSVKTELLGEMPVRPTGRVFDKTDQTSCDIKPGCAELVQVIRWPYPVRQPGFPSGPSAATAYGPIPLAAGGT